MSRRNRNRQQKVIVVAPEPLGTIHPAGVATAAKQAARAARPAPADPDTDEPDEPEVLHVTFTESRQQIRTTLDFQSGVGTIEASGFGCGRLITYHSIAWRCACGAFGPTGRSKDGVPYVDEEILAHAPGETRQ